MNWSLFEKDGLSGDSLRSVYKLVLDAHLEEDNVKFVHEVNVLVGLVLKIVEWEAVIAFSVLEGGELLGEKVNGGDAGGDKKSEKKKKKVVLGKGTGVIVQLIKDRLQSKGLGVLEKWVEDLFSFLDLKDPDFDGLLAKVKEIVKSNESRSLPKLPKIFMSSLLEIDSVSLDPKTLLVDGMVWLTLALTGISSILTFAHYGAGQPQMSSTSPFGVTFNEAGMSKSSFKWRRLLLKVSGLALAGDHVQKIDPKGPIQLGSVECGFYMMGYMRNIVDNGLVVPENHVSLLSIWISISVSVVFYIMIKGFWEYHT
ncbi:hypothetical protein Patl1_27426 [Pistacia atlantica]|uniref:Uncharacterized protein n=1 Tax=Pistacia atlantica TaxID=434234 RepID=A0ACC1BGA9_9ROSI|nr:hypothetical protein Patl1_27426 [Pistacia atlantica]